MTLRALVVDNTGEPGSGTEQPLRDCRGARLCGLASQVPGVEAHFVFHTLHLVYGFRLAEDYKEHRQDQLAGAAELQSMSEIGAEFRRGGVNSRSGEEAVRRELEARVGSYDLVLFHSSNDDVALDRKRLVAGVVADQHIPCIYYTGAGIDEDQALRSWRQLPSVLDMDAGRLEEILPRLLGHLISGQGSNAEGFRRAVAEVVFAERVVRELLDGFAALSILTLGALALFDHEANSEMPWLWPGRAPGPVAELAASALVQREVASFRKDPVRWFAPAASDLRGLCAAGWSEAGLESRLGELPEGARVAVRTVLHLGGPGMSPGRGLVMLAMAVVEAAAGSVAKQQHDGETMLDRTLLLEAHRQFKELIKQVCS